MHLLMLLDYYAPHVGGIETVFSEIIPRLLARGDDITVLTSRYDRSLVVHERYTHQNNTQKNTSLTIMRV